MAGALAAAGMLAVLGSAGLSELAGVGGPSAVRWPVAVVLGGLTGATYAVLYPRPRGAIGPGLVRGMNFGFLAWLALPMTLVPVLTGDHLPWILEDARARAASLPSTVLAGALFVVLYRLLTSVAGVLVADDPGELADEGVGTRALRGLARGTAAGLVGGALFTVVLVQVGGLSRIAGLVGGSSAGVGLAVHLVIAVVLGPASAWPSGTRAPAAKRRSAGACPTACSGGCWATVRCFPSCSVSRRSGPCSDWLAGSRPCSATWRTALAWD